MSIMGTGKFMLRFANRHKPAKWHLAGGIVLAACERITYLCTRPVLAPKAKRLTVRGIRVCRPPDTNTLNWLGVGKKALTALLLRVVERHPEPSPAKYPVIKGLYKTAEF